MPDPYAVEVTTSIAAIPAAEWDACANPADADGAASDGTSGGERFNPFVAHAFLRALEDSRSVGRGAGWSPAHLVVRDARNAVVAAAPAYLKSNSTGEYVFDFGWADAYRRSGLDYYPKIQVAVPFTPVAGPRLLTATGESAPARRALIGGLRALRKQTQATSIHVTFPTKRDWTELGEAGFLLRCGQQFHFINRGYRDFAAFLADLASRKRKMIRRERQHSLEDGVEIERLTGDAILEAHWDAFFEFYTDTSARKWGQPYLTRGFFSEVGAAMSARILLVMARRRGRYIAGALNFIGDDALYGRHWGAIENRPFLHFEVCYYQAIEFALERGLQRVEAGAQGEHKLSRGYVATPTYSAHEIADPRFARAIGEYLRHERLQTSLALDEYAQMTPFRRLPETEEF